MVLPTDTVNQKTQLFSFIICLSLGLILMSRHQRSLCFLYAFLLSWHGLKTFKSHLIAQRKVER